MTCKHFQSMEHPACKAGVVYKDILAQNPDYHATGLPCWVQANPTCPAQDWPTPAEIQAEEERVGRAVAAYLFSIQNHICPHCHAPYERQEQVGRCVYARPCGHRLYQGRVTDAGAG